MINVDYTYENILMEGDKMLNAVVSTENMSMEEWRNYRNKGIGGSDVAAICGLNKYKSPFQLWAEKTGNYINEDENESAYWGTVMESIIRNEFTKRTEFDVTVHKSIFQHPKHKFMLANIDGIVHAETDEFIFEAKTASAYKLEEWNTDYVPYSYQLQVQHYMAVTGLNGAYIAVLIGGNSFRYCYVERDDELIEMVIKLEKLFWDYVESNTPPPIDGSDVAKSFINSLYPVGIKNRIVTLDETCIKYINDYENSQEQEKRYCELKEQAANNLKQLIGDCEQARIDDRIVTWKNVSAERLDTKRLLNEKPDIYQKYLNRSTYRRFSIK